MKQTHRWGYFIENFDLVWQVKGVVARVPMLGKGKQICYRCISARCAKIENRKCRSERLFIVIGSRYLQAVSAAAVLRWTSCERVCECRSQRHFLTHAETQFQCWPFVNIRTDKSIYYHLFERVRSSTYNGRMGSVDGETALHRMRERFGKNDWLSGATCWKYRSRYTNKIVSLNARIIMEWKLWHSTKWNEKNVAQR